MYRERKFTTYAWSQTTKELAKIIMSGKYDIIELIYMHEFIINFNKRRLGNLSEELVNYINKKKIKIHCCTSAFDKEYVYNYLNITGINRDLVTIEVWPTFWFYESYRGLIEQHNPLYDNLENINRNFSTPFLTFNNKCREHRTKLINSIIKNNLLSSGIVTYHCDEFLKQNSCLTYKDDFTPGGNIFSFNETFLTSFLHIATETEVDVLFITEKTVKPILCQNPFLILGSVNFHKELQNLGFELYDELFDYSFDSEPDLTKRIEKLVKNINYVVQNKDNLNEMYQSILPKIIKNKKRVEDIVSSSTTVPKMIKRHYKTLLEKHDHSHFDKNLITIFDKITD